MSILQYLAYLIGMLSKSKGQILRVSAAMHVLFHWETPHDIPVAIGDEALKAAINLVDLCIQHAAFLAGRGKIDEAIESVQKTLLGNLPDFFNCNYSLIRMCSTKIEMNTIQFKYTVSKPPYSNTWQ